MKDKISGEEAKQMFIKASKTTIERYRLKEFSESTDDCAFCKVSDKLSDAFDCEPCPMSIKSGAGCTHFKSYSELRKAINDHPGEITTQIKALFERRINFHKYYLIPLMEWLPAKRFMLEEFHYIGHNWDKL